MAADSPSALAALATGSPSTAPQREIHARDVRDLALAVVEGAVAAEALAKELRRSPDRSRHFAEIAERLRAVVGRASIRTALAEDGAPTTLTLSGMRVASVVAPLPSMPTPPPSPSPPPPSSPKPTSPPPMPKVPSADEIARAVAALLHFEETTTRLARIEHVVAASMERMDATMQQAIGRTNAGERLVVSTAAEAIAVAQKLVDRVASRGPVVVRID